MILNYLKLSFRNIIKHKAFSAINIIGLAIGIAACLVLSQYAFLQHSFDKYHSKSDRLYRLEFNYYVDGNYNAESVYINYSLSEEIKTSIPQVEEVSRFGNIDYMNNTMIYKSDKGITSHNESLIYTVDKNIFESFDFDFIAGGYEQFDEPAKAIITEEIAQKYFQSNDPIGQKISLSGNIGSFDYEVVGVLKSLPEDTHFEFNVLLSFPSEKNYTGETNNRSYFTYLLLKEGVNQDDILEPLKAASEKVFANSFEKTRASMDFELQPLTKLQLHYPKFSSFKKTGNLKTVNILIIVAVIILLIAWFNYINLSTVKAIERAKEIGIRKVLGSQKKHILYQFVIESFLINGIAALISFTIVQVSLPILNSYLDFPVGFGLDLKFWLAVAAILLVGSLLSALYPASIMMGFSPLSILSKKITLNHGGVGFRKVLVVTQFVISVVLIAATITVYKQVSFMTSADLGINIQNMVVIKSPPGDISSRANSFFEAVGTFRNELESSSLVSVMTTSSSVPGKELGWGSRVKKKAQSDKDAINMALIAVGDNYEKAYGLELKAGRLIEDGDNPWGNGNVIVNEEAVFQLGYATAEESIGKRLSASVVNGADLIIRGVVGNHNQGSLKNNYQAIIYMPSVWSNYFSVKLNVNENLPKDQQLDQVKDGLQLISDKWAEIFPYATFDYAFLDEEFDNLYKNDRQFGLIFGIFAGLAIIIASLGLLGLSSFAIARRTKEIGVRKVLGASDAHVVKLLSKEYVILIIVANLIAVPTAWYFLSSWLENYHFRIDLGWWMAVVPLAIVLFISIATISLKVLKVASGNPVDSLRYE